jgi:flagellar hook assembly protein FlgD
MKRLVLAGLIALTLVMVASISPAKLVLADSTTNIPQQKLQEDLLKYKYPYSEVSAVERVQLAQYAINQLTDQIAHFRPGQGTTMAYLKSTLSHMQELISSPVSETITPEMATGYVSGAAVTPVPVNMIFYGTHDSVSDQRIINAAPQFLVSNSPAGPWKTADDISQFVGIHYFEYIDGGYEGTAVRSIPNDLQSNLNYISAAQQAGAYGIFLDEVSDGIWHKANYSYLRQITDYAHTLGLKVVFNTGVSDWSAQLMNYCDYMNSSETWNLTSTLTTIQSTYANRIWLETEGVTDADTAAQLTEYAWSKGVLAQYSCYKYLSLPDWLVSYISDLRTYTTPLADFSLTATPTSVSFTGGGSGTFNVAITPSAGFTGSVTLSASNPSGLNVTGSPPTVSSPYPATTFTLTSNTPDTYVVIITGTSGTLTHTASVSVSVKAPSTPTLSASVSTDSSRYRAGQTVTSTASVRSSGSAVSNAGVTITIKNQSGTVVYSGSGTTNSRGSVSFAWNTGRSSSGTYTVTVAASKTGYTPGSGSTSFTIR